MSHDELADCGPVLRRLYEFLDGECTEAEADEIRLHLDACDRCVEDADVALALKALVRRCCLHEPAPETLRIRMVAQYRAGLYQAVEYTEVTEIRRDLA